MHTLHIRLFARFADRAGATSVTVILDEDGPVTVARLKHKLQTMWPDLTDLVEQSFIAKNMAYASLEETLNEHDEIAIIPPVSGGEETGSRGEETGSGAGKPLFWLTEERIESDDVLNRVIDANHGASIVFVGTTREWTAGMRTTRLEYEAYEPMALRTMEQIAAEIEARWPGTKLTITHRLGVVDIAEISIVIAVSSGHRDEAYAASRYAIDRVKEIVPIWKKEIWEDGSEWKGHQSGIPWDPLG